MPPTMLQVPALVWKVDLVDRRAAKEKANSTIDDNMHFRK